MLDTYMPDIIAGIFIIGIIALVWNAGRILVEWLG